MCIIATLLVVRKSIRLFSVRISFCTNFKLQQNVIFSANCSSGRIIKTHDDGGEGTECKMHLLAFFSNCIAMRIVGDGEGDRERAILSGLLCKHESGAVFSPNESRQFNKVII